jgi:hypothetical protein
MNGPKIKQLYVTEAIGTVAYAKWENYFFSMNTDYIYYKVMISISEKKYLYISFSTILVLMNNYHII